MNEPPPARPGDRVRTTYLLHARPRLLFHVGHLRMLNALYELLVRGNDVVLLLIPYEEREKNNMTIKNRLGEEIELTKGFYQSYLGFDAPRLKIVSTRDLDLSPERTTEIWVRYSALYDGGAPAVSRLIAQNRDWSSPNTRFVAKCLAAIENLRPDRLICGAKHKAIAECFDEVLRNLGVDIPCEMFDDFPDLFMESAMDRTDSVHSYIEISDDEDFVLHKLSALSDRPDLRGEWLRAFMRHIYEPAPQRVKNGVRPVQRTDTERQIALTRMLAGVRALIPYSMDEGADDVRITWKLNVGSDLGPSERRRIERIARQLFQGGKSPRVEFYREFPGGKSGALVLEAREYEEPGDLRVSNVSILKIGPEHELRAERENYERFVRAHATGAFMTIKRGAVSIDGVAGIVYQDAQHRLGIRRQERIDNISALFRPLNDDAGRAGERLGRLLESHLHEVLYKHGTRVDAGGMRPYINEFLPAEHRVEVSRYLPDGHVITSGRDGAGLRAEVEISEVDLERRVARAYTLDDHRKIDVHLSGGDEILLNEVRPGRRLRLEGRILATRQDFYGTLLDRLGVRRGAGRLAFDGVRVTDPGDRTEEFLEREHYSFVLSPIHGDLHAGNVLFGGDGFGIIDYGKMRERFPALYDVAYLYADLKSRLVADLFDPRKLAGLEEAIASGGGPGWTRRNRRSHRHAERLSLFEYDALPGEIKLLGQPGTFYSLLGLILLGRLKFDVPEAEKRAGLVLAHYAFERA